MKKRPVEADRELSKAAPHALQTLETVKARLLAARGASRNWEVVAREFGVSVGTAVRVANGYEPKTPSVRAALHLSPYVPTLACPVHGVVHTAKRCPKAPPRWDYGEWRRDNMGRLLAIVAWAETPPAERRVWKRRGKAVQL